MATMARRFPQGLHYSIPYDTTTFVTDSINEVYKTLYQAGILVLIVILVFLQNFRATLVPATTVPVTIIGAFAGMAALGFTVNLSTLFGIVLAIGIVVDDAIVIVEGVSKYIEQGMSGHDCGHQGDERTVRADHRHHAGADERVPAGRLRSWPDRQHVRPVRAGDRSNGADQCGECRNAQADAVRPVAPHPGAARAAQLLLPRLQSSSTSRMERGYATFIGRMVRRSGIMVVIALLLAGVGIWGLARLPTAFIPIDDQGYLILAVQLPEGASLGRTTAALEEVNKVARAIPGVQQIIAIAGMSVLDNSADLANAGTCWVMLKPFDVRLKAKDQDLLSIYRRLQAAVASLPDGQAFVLPPPPIQGIGNAGGFQMQLEMLGGSFDYQKLNDLAQEIVKQAQSDPALANVLTTFRPDAPHVALTVDRARAETLARFRWRCVRDAHRLCRIDLRQPVQQVRPLAAGLCPGRFAVSPAAGRSAEPVRPQPGWADGADRRCRPSRSGGRAAADHAVQSLPVGHDRWRPGARFQFGPVDGRHGADRPAGAAERRQL